jgi:hypothetical protein
LFILGNVFCAVANIAVSQMILVALIIEARLAIAHQVLEYQNLDPLTINEIR